MWNNDSNTTIQNWETGHDDTLLNWKSVENCVPVMLAHLHRYGEGLKIWGMPTRIITFLAIVEDVDVVNTRVNFKFRDETGSLKGVQWLCNEIYECPVKINSYARVYGSMRKQNYENFILVAKIQPMDHLNELCAHLMEVTFICLEAENLSIQASQNHSANNTSIKNNNPSIFAPPSNDDNDCSNLTYEQNLVMDIITRGHPEDGAERSAIKCQVPLYLAPKVDAILEFLSSEGHVYTTKTDDYFKKL
ncbi:replication protein A 32 kDa subunit-like [Phymastichus coffea]|uniref:replication protein A 32 kDa subunit-like n=1 Tax=Phymastichus coffea TaxID=108790 RepID=UPI00273B797B|nr:replication protein A 32 kDa subunit-like [Phymastichus coffea]